MRHALRSSALLAALIVASVTTGCGGAADVTGSVAPVTTQPAGAGTATPSATSATIGSYGLSTYNGGPTPVLVESGPTTRYLLADTLEVRADGTFSERARIRTIVNRDTTVAVDSTSGTWKRSADAVAFLFPKTNVTYNATMNATGFRIIDTHYWADFIKK